MTRRNRSQMTLEAFEEEQQSLNDWDGDDTTPPTPRTIDDGTIPAVVPAGTYELVDELEAAI